ncbi:hypothetical protein [Rothia nasimurium]|uniref:hypothetical protein n=1 Tax=Rothia nasimurium TaxID=85336 RepID=UPI001F3FD5C8|nr:hypothetical protein [Rothia nasimurium]
MNFASPTPPPSPGGLLPSGHEWDFSTTGVYWLDYLIDVIAIALVLAGVFLPLYLTRVHPHIKKLREDAAAIRQQTENSHADAPHPNLRDNIDANQAESRAAFQALMQASDQLREALAQQAKDIGGIRAELRADREAQRETARALAEHIRDGTHKTP